MTATPHATAAVPRLRRLADAIDAVVDRLSEPRAFAAAVAGYYVVAFLIRTLVLTVSSGDEAQLMLYSQGFACIYAPGKPTLTTRLAADHRMAAVPLVNTQPVYLAG